VCTTAPDSPNLLLAARWIANSPIAAYCAARAGEPCGPDTIPSLPAASARRTDTVARVSDADLRL